MNLRHRIHDILAGLSERLGPTRAMLSIASTNSRLPIGDRAGRTLERVRRS